MTLTWVESMGGPLLVAAQSDLLLWKGTADINGPVETWGDYGRACTVEGYIGLVAIGEGQGLVLGDQPATTTYLHDERLFLRWMAAHDESDLVTAARRALRDGMQWDDDEDLVWNVDGPIVLFDSAWSGAELEADNHLVIDVEPGRYRVRGQSRRRSQPDDPDSASADIRSRPHAVATLLRAGAIWPGSVELDFP